MTPVRVRVPSKKERKRRNRVGKACRASKNEIDKNGDCLICLRRALEKSEEELFADLEKNKPEKQVLFFIENKGGFFSEEQLRLIKMYYKIKDKWKSTVSIISRGRMAR